MSLNLNLHNLFKKNTKCVHIKIIYFKNVYKIPNVF